MVKFARCNALLSLAIDASGKGCRYVAQGESEDAVVKVMSDHLKGVHDVATGEMDLNIRGATKTTRK